MNRTLLTLLLACALVATAPTTARADDHDGADAAPEAADAPQAATPAESPTFTAPTVAILPVPVGDATFRLRLRRFAEDNPEGGALQFAGQVGAGELPQIAVEPGLYTAQVSVLDRERTATYTDILLFEDSALYLRVVERRTARIATGATAAAFAFTAIVTVLATRFQQEECRTFPEVCAQDEQDRRDRARNGRLAAGVLLGAGAGLGVTTALVRDRTRVEVVPFRESEEAQERAPRRSPFEGL